MRDLPTSEKSLVAEIDGINAAFDPVRKRWTNTNVRKRAAAIYKKIFYERSFNAQVMRNRTFAFDASVFSKVNSCGNCRRQINQYLKDFADAYKRLSS